MSRITGLTPRLPVAGRIALGTRDEQRGFPKASKHFIIPAEYQSLLGTAPNSLEIVFPSNDEEIVAKSQFEYYQPSVGYVCTSNGDTARRIGDNRVRPLDDGSLPVATSQTPAQAQEIQRIPCPASECVYFKAKKCHKAMHLRFMIPKSNAFGVFTLNTGSQRSMENIYSTLDMVRHMAGHIDGISFELKLVAEQAKNPATGKMTEVMRLHLRPLLSHSDLVAERQRWNLKQEPLRLTEPEDNDVVDADFEEMPESHLLDEALKLGGELVETQPVTELTPADIAFRQRLGVDRPETPADPLAHLELTVPYGVDKSEYALAETDLSALLQIDPYRRDVNGKIGINPQAFWAEADKTNSREAVMAILDGKSLTEWLKENRKRSLRGLLYAAR